MRRFFCFCSHPCSLGHTCTRMHGFFKVMMFVASFKSFPGFDRANSLVVLHASLWGLVTIIGLAHSILLLSICINILRLTFSASRNVRTISYLLVQRFSLANFNGSRTGGSTHLCTDVPAFVVTSTSIGKANLCEKHPFMY